MANIYKTKSGDVWDVIARKVYGNESYTSFLMKNNQQYLEYFVFPDGIELECPELPNRKKTTFPDWRS